MMMKTLLVPLCLLLITLAGACSYAPNDISVKSGEMVALKCKYFKAKTQSDAGLVWTNPEGKELSINMSSAEQRQMGVLLYRRSLVILSSALNHQGKYSCIQRSSRTHIKQFRLRVYSSQSTEYEKNSTYPQECYTQESCTLECPDNNIPNEDTPGITSIEPVWHKKGESFPSNGYFPNVEEKDHGVYTCTRSYLYQKQVYNMSFTVVLEVLPNGKSVKVPEITSPRPNDVFHVDMDSTAVIPCEAVECSDSDSLFWLSGNSLLDTDENQPVFYNSTGLSTDTGKIIASLIIKKVTKEHLSKNYTCKLESAERPMVFTTITLAQKARPSYVSLAVGIVCSVVMMVVISVIYVKFKITITLFLRDTLGCHGSTSDGKSYDAFLMFYKSDIDAGLNEEDREWLKSALEEKFGYSLCLHDRDILPGKAVAEAVLDCIEQSRTVVLVPTSPDPGLESGLLSAIHSALVERETRLVFIKTESKEVLKSGSVHEALQLLNKAGGCVTWKGKHSSSFWKQLRYHLPAPQHTPKIKLLPHTV